MSNYRGYTIASGTKAHSAAYNRWSQHYQSGAYSIDKTEPESMDLPEVCSFRKDDGLLDIKDNGECTGEIIVVVDKEFGVIPVCRGHSIHCIRPKAMSYKQSYKQYLSDN